MDAAVRKVMMTSEPARRRVHGLWVLQRRGALDDATLLACADDADRELRVHSLKVLLERPELARPVHEAALAATRDADPFVRRAAAEALGAHPELANIRPLLALRQSSPADDNHLIHVARMALRDQLKTADTWKGLETLGLSERDRGDIADVAMGVHSPEAAAYLLGYLGKYGESPENWLRYVHHIARYAAAERIDGLAELVHRAGKHGRRVQAQLVKSIHQGIQERGMPPGAAMHGLAVEHVRALLGFDGCRRDRPGDRAGQRAAAPGGPGQAGRGRGTVGRRDPSTLGRVDRDDGDRPGGQ